MVTRIYGDAVNYRSGGAWHEIDNRLAFNADNGGSFDNTANGYSLRLPDDLGGAPVRLSDGDASLAFKLAGADGRATASGATATYAEALPGVDVEYTAENNAVKESLTLDGPASPSAYRFSLSVSDGIRPRTNAAGQIAFFDRDGQVRFALDRPFMEDSSTGPGSRSNAVRMKVRRAGTGYVIEVKADKKWLKDPKRKYPVVIDPTTRVVAGTDDCYLVGGSAATSFFCGYSFNWLDVGTGGGTNGADPRRTFLNFNTSGIPKEAVVLYAELGLYLNDGLARPVDVNGLTRSSTSARTWNTYDGTHPWTTPGGDITDVPDATNPTVGPNAGWYQWYPSDLVQGWVSGEIPNNGMLLSTTAVIANNVLHFRSSEQTASAPYLSVRWEYATGTRDTYTFETEDLGNGLSVNANVATGNVMLKQNDLQLDGGALQWGLDRFYSSCNIWDFELGKAWTNSTWDVFLSQYGDSVNGAYRRVVFWSPSFAPIPFERQPDGSYDPPGGVSAELVRNADGTRTVTFDETGRTYQFSSGGTLRSESTADGGSVVYTFNGANGNMDSATTGAGEVTRFGYDSADYLTSMTDPSGGVTRYAYVPNGSGSGPPLLSSVTNPAGQVTKYTYYPDTSLSSVTAPSGAARKFAYDSQRRVTSVTQVTNVAAGTGPATTYAYFPGYTTVTSPTGTKKTYFYDPDLHVVGTQTNSAPGVFGDGTLQELQDDYDPGDSDLGLTVTGVDTGGVRSVALQVDGVQKSSAAATCTPSCPASFAAELSTDGRLLTAGRHTITIVATGADGEITSSSAMFYIDRTAPTAPTALRADYDAGRGKAQLSWTNGADPALPGGFPGSGIHRHEWRMLLANGTWTEWTGVGLDEPAYVTAAAGSSIRFQVRSHDYPDNTSPIADKTVVVGVGPPPKAYDGYDTCPGTSPQISGAWTCYPSGPASLAAPTAAAAGKTRLCDESDADTGGKSSIIIERNRKWVMTGTVAHGQAGGGPDGYKRRPQMKMFEYVQIYMNAARHFTITPSWDLICGLPTDTRVRANVFYDDQPKIYRGGFTRTGNDTKSFHPKPQMKSRFLSDDYRIHITFFFDSDFGPFTTPKIISARIDCTGSNKKGKGKCRFNPSFPGTPR
jgi:YD repeat-containing protein